MANELNCADLKMKAKNYKQTREKLTEKMISHLIWHKTKNRSIMNHHLTALQHFSRLFQIFTRIVIIFYIFKDLLTIFFDTSINLWFTYSKIVKNQPVLPKS